MLSRSSPNQPHKRGVRFFTTPADKGFQQCNFKSKPNQKSNKNNHHHHNHHINTKHHKSQKTYRMYLGLRWNAVARTWESSRAAQFVAALPKFMADLYSDSVLLLCGGDLRIVNVV